MKGAIVLAVAAAACPLSACVESVPLPVRAARVEQRQCAGAAAVEDELRTLRSMTVVKAESKCHVDYCNGAGQVFGVKLVLRQPEGVSAEQLAQMLRCHNVRVLLGQVGSSQLPNDPYWLPDSWVEIEVKPDAGNLVVTLNGDTVSDNLRILHRATAFAAAHGSAGSH
jgi:hypothetical protein